MDAVLFKILTYHRRRFQVPSLHRSVPSHPDINLHPLTSVSSPFACQGNLMLWWHQYLLECTNNGTEVDLPEVQEA